MSFDNSAGNKPAIVSGRVSHGAHNSTVQLHMRHYLLSHSAVELKSISISTYGEILACKLLCIIDRPNPCDNEQNYCLFMYGLHVWYAKSELLRNKWMPKLFLVLRGLNFRL